MEYIEVELKIEPLEPGRDVMVAYLGEIGFDSFVENDKGSVAYIPSSQWDEEALKDAIERLDFARVSYGFKTIADQNWNATWEAQFEPIDVAGKCYIRAPFHASKAGVRHEIVIQPQMSFGTGHHATTFQVVKSMLSLDFEGKSVLDMGSGTAILAILAEQLGAKYVDAIDIEEWAYNNAKENAELNECHKIEVKLGDADLLPSEPTYHIVLANINRNILLADMDRYVKSMLPKAYILFSGFFPGDNALISDKATSLGLEMREVNEKDGWSQLTFQLN